MADVLARSARLREKMTLQNLYEITTENGDQVAARYLEGGEEKQITYAEYRLRTDACAALLRKALGEKKQGAFVGITGAAGSGSPGGPGGEPAEDLLPLRRRRCRDGVRILRHAF